MFWLLIAAAFVMGIVAIIVRPRAGELSVPEYHEGGFRVIDLDNATRKRKGSLPLFIVVVLIGMALTVSAFVVR